MDKNNQILYFSTLFSSLVNNDRYILAHTISVSAREAHPEGRDGLEGKIKKMSTIPPSLNWRFNPTFLY